MVGEVEKIRTVDADGKVLSNRNQMWFEWEDVEVDMATHVNKESGKEFEYPKQLVHQRK